MSKGRRHKVEAACLALMIAASLFTSSSSPARNRNDGPPQPRSSIFQPYMTVKPSTNRSGSPVDLTISTNFTSMNDEQIKDMLISMPAGFAPDANAVPYCEQEELDNYNDRFKFWIENDYKPWNEGGQQGDMPPYPSLPCTQSVIGSLEIDAISYDDTNPNGGWHENPRSGVGFIVNMRPKVGFHGRIRIVVHTINALGFIYFRYAPPVTVDIDIKVDERGDFHLENNVLDIPWGLPLADPILRPDDFSPLKSVEMRVNILGSTGSSNGHPLMRLPTKCGRYRFTGNAVSWFGKAHDLVDTSMRVRGCGSLDFSPSIEVDAGTTRPSTPTDFGLTIKVPHKGQGQADIKSMSLDLPNGLGIDMGTLSKVKSCKRDEAERANCPQESKIADVEAVSPLVPGGEPLSGGLFMVEPKPGSGLGIMADLKGFAHLSLLGDLTISSTIGLSTFFDSMPQFPIDYIKVKMAKGLIKSPSQCGTYRAKASFQSWSGKKHKAYSTFEIECKKEALSPTLTAKLSRKKGLTVRVKGSSISSASFGLTPFLKRSLLRSNAKRSKLLRSLKRFSPKDIGSYSVSNSGKLKVNPKTQSSTISFSLPRKILASCVSGKLKVTVKTDEASFNLNKAIRSLCRKNNGSHASFSSISLKGLFSEPRSFEVPGGAGSLDVEDINGDGTEDAVVTSASGSGVYVLIGTNPTDTASGMASPISLQTTYGSFSFRNIDDLNISDLNRDGRPDIAASIVVYYSGNITSASAPAVLVFRNDTIKGQEPEFHLQNTFGTSVSGCTNNVSKRTLTVSDLNSDNLDDFAVAAPECDRVHLYFNDSAVQTSREIHFKQYPRHNSSNPRESYLYNMLSIDSPVSVASYDLFIKGDVSLAYSSYLDMNDLAIFSEGGGPFRGVPGSKIDFMMNKSPTPAMQFDYGPPSGPLKEFFKLEAESTVPSALGFSDSLFSDLNGDNNDDLIALNKSQNSVAIWKNKGTSLFSGIPPVDDQLSFSIGRQPVSYKVTDVNEDGRKDILSANADGTISILYNSSAIDVINFSSPDNYSIGGTISDIDTGDLDNDGDEEILLSRSSPGDIVVLYNNTYTPSDWPSDLPPIARSPGFTASFTGEGNLKLQLDAGEDAPGLAKAKVTLPFKLKGKQKGYRVESIKKKKTVIKLTSSKAEGERSLKLTLKKKRMRIKKCGPFSFKSTVEDAGKASTNLKAKAKRPKKLCRKKSRRRK